MKLERFEGEAMGPIGLPEMVALFVIALLLFGPKKLPELGRTLGKGLSEFRRAKNELKATLESHMQEIERETKIETPQLNSSYTYPYESYGNYDGEYQAPEQRELTSPQQAAVEANAAAADPAAHGVPPMDELPPAPGPVAGTVPRSNGVQPSGVQPSGVQPSVSHAETAHHETAPHDTAPHEPVHHEAGTGEATRVEERHS